MRLPRRNWLVAGIAALLPLLGGLALNRMPQQVAGQSSPHGTLPVGTVPPQVRHAFPPPRDAQPPTPSRGHDPQNLIPIGKRGGPGEDGKPEHTEAHGGGNGHGADAGTGSAAPDTPQQP